MATAALTEKQKRVAYEAVKEHGTVAEAARKLGVNRLTLDHQFKGALAGGFPDPRAADAKAKEAPVGAVTEKIRAALRRSSLSLDAIAKAAGVSAGEALGAIDALINDGVRVRREPNYHFALDIEAPAAAWTKGPAVELVSRPDNTFCFGAFGDLHAGSKYTRWEVREDLVRQSEARGAQAIFDTGNWIDGEARFNRYDLEAVGLHSQVKLLAARHPKTSVPVYAVAGDDHEGWYSQREGMDVGWYAEKTMREAGHQWTDLGYMEAHVKLTNANTGKSCILAVVHPGGGSSYAVSYRPQKIIESYEGGEKPAVVLFGHYHKLSYEVIRNVFSIQTGTQQDQTPFMRKKSLEAHVGGAIVRLEQDPETGAIVECDVGLRRYFNRAYYDASARWSHSGPVSKPPRAR